MTRALPLPVWKSSVPWKVPLRTTTGAAGAAEGLADAAELSGTPPAEEAGPGDAVETAPGVQVGAPAAGGGSTSSDRMNSGEPRTQPTGRATARKIPTAT